MTTTLTIADLPRVDTMHRGAMSAVRGGIATITLPPGSNTLPGVPSLPASWPGASFFKDLHIPTTWPVHPEPVKQDPRLL
jgi:hypothetical protein